MSDAEETRRDRFAQRLWCGAFGAFLGGVLGMILAGSLHGSLIDGTLVGALVGGFLAFLFGLGVFDLIFYV